MRIGAVYELFPHYRAIAPLRAMEQRGHVVVWPDAARGWNVGRLKNCDVIHVYRVHGPKPYPHLAALARRGIPIVYDNDDDMAALVVAENVGDAEAAATGERVHRSTVKMARLARVFTTPSAVLAEKYRAAGVQRVEVIENCLEPHLDARRHRHKGIVIGWIAGVGHQPDVAALALDEAVRRVLSKHRKARVECIGVDLRMADRYRHDAWVPFPDLPPRIGGFDIGLAPLADTAVNRARSDIKVKEYAARGIPWLASPVGPYNRLGEEQGGRLVQNDEWFDALDRLVAIRRDRRRLGNNAKTWAQTQTIDGVANRWERVFTEAASTKRRGRRR